MLDPFIHLLGVEADADAMTLLGIEGAPTSRHEIEAALQRRLEEVFSHPDGRSAEAEVVRRRLRRVASMLIARGPRARLGERRRGPGAAVKGKVSGHALTEFDRSVLAILVGTGGWNARSRALLVAHAGAHQVTPVGLLKVMRGLGDYARAGGAPIPTAAIAPAGQRRRGPFPTIPVVNLPPRPVRIDAPGNAWPVVRLSILFGLITIFVAVLILSSLWSGDEEPVTPWPDRASAVAPVVETPAAGARVPAAPRVLRFRRPPTFLGNALPQEATDAADESPRLPDDLDRLTRKLSLTDEPSDAVYHEWAAIIDTIARGWVLVDDSTRRRIERGLALALAEAGDTPSVSDRLLDSFIPPRGRLSQPIDVWRGAYLAARLGGITGDDSLPPAVIERAQGQLAVALGESSAAGARGPRRAADRWLRQALDGLVELTEIDPRVYDYWESWMAAERKLGDEGRLQDAWMDAVDRLLATDTDLGREGPSLYVLGRLLTVADFGGEPIVRDRIAGFYDDHERITADDLWVLTSLLAQLDTAPWFTTEFVLPHHADAAFRRRMRDRVVLAWPPPAARHSTREMAAGRGVPIEADDLDRWLAVVPEPSSVVGDNLELMERLVLAAMVNEAATLFAARRPEEARAILQELTPVAPADAATSTRPRLNASGGGGGGVTPSRTAPGRRPTPTPRTPPGPGGRGITRGGAGGTAGGSPGGLGPDGVWAASFDEARRNTQEKLERLRQLRLQAGGDLGPLDAEAFVRVVYRGSPQDVRTLARDIAIDQFTRGANVAIELLDQLPDAPRQEGISELVHGVTGRLLPPVRHATWMREARLALVEHALALRVETDVGVDDNAIDLAEIYARRRAVVAGDTTPAVAGKASVEARRLADAWTRRASVAMSADPIPDDLEGLRRRRAIRYELASGPIQRVVADALTTLEHLAYIAVAEQPSLREAVANELAESATRRQACRHVLAQAIEVEIAASRLWQLRFQEMEAAP